MFYKYLLATLAAATSIVNAAIIVERQTTVGSTTPACDVWDSVREDLIENRFDGGECGEEVHESLRLTFHDAIGFSKSGQIGGGADGSIVTFSDIEQQDSANLGTEAAADDMRDFATRHNVTFGDMIQFAGAVAVALCPGAPRLEFLAGRPPAVVPAAKGLVPEPFDSVDDILARFSDAGLAANEVIALLASHTVAAQDHVDPTIAGSPFDSTPALFDSQFFVETQLRGTSFPGTGGNHGEVESPLRGELRLQSDHNLARDSKTSCEWQSFVNNQQKLQSAFRAAMSKMAILGHARATLVDCSSTVPIPAAFNRAASFPAGKSKADVEQACASTPFPTLATDPGAQSSVAPVPSS